MKKTLIITGALAIILAGGSFLSQSPAESPAAESEVGIVGITKVDSAAAVGSVGSRTISWKTAGYPENIGVDINLIKKTGSSPASYIFVRKIAENTANDGNEIWDAQKQDIGEDLFIEVVCSGVSSGCRVTSEPIPVN